MVRTEERELACFAPAVRQMRLGTRLMGGGAPVPAIRTDPPVASLSMSNPIPRRAVPDSASEAPSDHELLARIRTLETERDRLRAEVEEGARSRTAALRDDEERFRVMADAVPGMLWVTGTDNRCVFLSRGWYEYTGQTQEEGLGFGWLQAVHPEDRDEAARRFIEASEGRQPFSLDHRLRRRDGGYRWVIDEGRPRFGEEGEWRGYVGSVIDVHDRWLATEAFRRSEAKYRALFESIDAGFCVIQLLFDDQGRPADYRFLETNPAFIEQTGLKGAVGRTARELLPALEEHWFQIYGDVALTGVPIRFENGSRVMQRWFDVYAFRVEEPKQRRVALLFTDISEHKRADDERERLLHEAKTARAEAEVANRTKADFLASMSHELRTPLNAIGGYVELLDMEIHGPLADAQRGALARITANQRHLLTLINDILSFARMEAGRMEFDLRALSALELLASVESLVAPQAEARGVAYTLDACSPDLRFRGDVERVRQILLNLVGNAIKFTAAGGWVILACDADEEWVHFRVRDTGVGIPPEEQERIFDPFQQVGRRLNKPQEGVGLGLAISRDLARAMSGDLTVQSTPGEGSVFTLRLPRLPME
jgi:PAS domain S-box-containing protein